MLVLVCREVMNPTVSEMVEQFVAAAEHQYKVVGPDLEPQSRDNRPSAAEGGGGALARATSSGDRMLAEQLGREAAGTASSQRCGISGVAFWAWRFELSNGLGAPLLHLQPSH